MGRYGILTAMMLAGCVGQLTAADDAKKKPTITVIDIGKDQIDRRDERDAVEKFVEKNKGEAYQAEGILEEAKLAEKGAKFFEVVVEGSVTDRGRTRVVSGVVRVSLAGSTDDFKDSVSKLKASSAKKSRVSIRLEGKIRDDTRGGQVTLEEAKVIQMELVRR